MLSGTSFRSVFVFNIDLLILSGFLLTSFHLTKASLSASFGLFLFLYEQLSKNITKYILFIIIHILSTHFAIRLFITTT